MSQSTVGLGISSHPVLGVTECRRVWDLLLQNQRHWTERPIPGAGAGVFHTLGRASYIDVSGSADPERDYYGALVGTNAVMRRHFTWLLDRVRVVLAEVLGAPVGYVDGLALPGFHLFDQETMGTPRNARAHFDLQYAALRFPVAPDPGPVLSFTLPIVLPAGGGGLDVWNITHDEYQRDGLDRDYAAPDEFIKGRRKRTVRYRPGRMVVQRKHILHRIAAVGSPRPTGRRVTLQGHGLQFGQGWGLYW